MNEIFLGQNGARAIHGFGLGAQFYFNKPINELDVAEIATLISIIRGPSYYNPFRHPERAPSRRNRILDTFFSDGLIAAQTHARAIERPLGELLVAVELTTQRLWTWFALNCPSGTQAPNFVLKACAFSPPCNRGCRRVPNKP